MDNSALLMIDMQKGFLHPDGTMYWEDTESVIQNCLKALHTARQNKILIIHTQDQHRKGFKDFENYHVPEHCLEGSFDAEYAEGFGPISESGTLELGLIKRRYSAFFSTDLNMILRENDIKFLYVAGVKTNVCVRATIQDAYGLGFQVRLIQEATSSNRKHLAKASLEDIERYMGKVIKIDEFLN